MSPRALKEQAALVRRYWAQFPKDAWVKNGISEPGEKLLKMIEAMPDPLQLRVRQAAVPDCDSKEHGHCRDCGYCEKDGQCLCYAR